MPGEHITDKSYTFKVRKGFPEQMKLDIISLIIACVCVINYKQIILNMKTYEIFRGSEKGWKPVKKYVGSKI